ncbi:NAC domain [Dillenia turbinata]|uniref:NAC domain n=1 Tax=Dillenia turbinata TaxID=194707 RepID=A0AAN8W5I9_9MAGN
MAGSSNVNLPPGFRFYPTDEELVVHFLRRKATLLPCHPDVIPDLDLYSFDPWELEGKALGEGNQWYYFSRRTQNRITNNGYWKVVGADEPINATKNGRKIGIKKCLVFYIGEAPGGSKTNWIMHEYRLPEGASSSSRSKTTGKAKIDYSKWVVCRVYEQSCGGNNDANTELSCLDEVFLSLDDLDEISLPN